MNPTKLSHPIMTQTTWPASLFPFGINSYSLPTFTAFGNALDEAIEEVLGRYPAEMGRNTVGVEMHHTYNTAGSTNVVHVYIEAPAQPDRVANLTAITEELTAAIAPAAQQALGELLKSEVKLRVVLRLLPMQSCTVKL